jgi:hypothetical protein
LSGREFFKESRRLNFDDSGSLRLSNIEQEAYRNIVTFEAVDIQGFRYRSFKYLPSQTFLGYATVFEGASVTRAIQLGWNLQRLSDTRNTGLWNRYAVKELAELVIGTSEATANAVIQELSAATPDLIEFVIQLFEPTSAAGDAFYGWLLSLVSDPSTVPDAQEYRPLPIDTPHPTAIKVLTDVPCRFSLRLDSWYLVNPATFIVGGEVDSSEATDGEDQYGGGPDGTGNDDGGNYGDGNESSLDPNSDGRDKDLGGVPAELTEDGKQYKIIYDFQGRVWREDGSEQLSFSSEDQTFEPLTGPIGNVFVRYTGNAPQGPANYELLVDTKNLTASIRSGSSQGGYVVGSVGAFNIRFEEI